VVEETVNGGPQRGYTYGLQRIDEDQVIDNVWTPSYYGYDGFGTVRQLTNASGAVTDTWEYDAFGNVLNRTGSTPNEMLYRGEAFDSNLGLYYLRARWMNTVTGRFLSRDTVNGDIANPPTLHKYLYADGDPVNGKDPAGRDDLAQTAEVDEDLSVAENTEVKEVGEDVACQLETDAATLGAAIGPEGETLASLVPEGKQCTAIARYECIPGQKIYRVYGGPRPKAQPWGPWWSLVDPRTFSSVAEWRAGSGVEEAWNDATNVKVGILNSTDGCTTTPATPSPTFPNAWIPSYVIENPQSTVTLIETTTFPYGAPMSNLSERDQLFRKVPGPSPWYLSDELVPVEGFSWKQPESGKGKAAGKVILQGPSGIVGVFDFYNYVKVLNSSTLLVWNQKRRKVPLSQAVPIELYVIDLAALEQIPAPLDPIYERLDAGHGFFVLGGTPSATMALQVTDVENPCYAEFPDVMRSMEELLILCHSPMARTSESSANLALIVAEPRASIYRLYPQDWFNNSDLDFSYEWVTRVVRNPNTGRVEGEGFRIPPFVLDHSLRDIEKLTGTSP